MSMIETGKSTEERIAALERKYKEATARIQRLENIVSVLTGTQAKGVLTMREAREALERGDKLTWEKFIQQEGNCLKAGGRHFGAASALRRKKMTEVGGNE